MLVVLCVCRFGEVVCVWVGGWEWVWVGVRGGGLEGYVSCCDNLYYGFFFFDLKQTNSSMTVYYCQFKCF